MDAQSIITQAQDENMSFATLTAYIEGLHNKGDLSDSDYQAIIKYIQNGVHPKLPGRDIIQLYRGNRADLPQLAEGEPAFAMDTNEFYVGNTSENVLINDRTPRKPRVIIIGDEFATGDSPNGKINGFPYYAKSYGRLNSANFFTSAQNGAGFTNDGFLNLINSANATEPNTITDIYVCGGYNDLASDTNTNEKLQAAMKAFYTQAKKLYKNANIHLLFLPWTKSNISLISPIITTFNRYKNMNFWGFILHINASYIMHANINFGVDGINPSLAGQYAIGQYLADIIRGVDTEPFQTTIISQVRDDGTVGATWPKDTVVQECIRNGYVYKSIYSRQVFNYNVASITTPFNYTLDGANTLKIGAYSQQYTSGDSKIGIAVWLPTTFILTSANADFADITVPGTIFLNSTGLHALPSQLSNTKHNSSITIPNLKYIQFNNCQCTFPIITA